MDKLTLSIDLQLKSIVKHHCKCNNQTQSYFISKCIANELGIKINDDGTLNANDYIDSKIKTIDDCINRLEKEKSDLKKSLED